jgi:hypothetical protein
MIVQAFVMARARAAMSRFAKCRRASFTAAMAA